MSISYAAKEPIADDVNAPRPSGLDRASTEIRRRHYFELHDQSWWPVPMREFMTNLLIIAWTFPWISLTRNGRKIVPSFATLTARVIERLLTELDAMGQPVSRVTDLCSGSGGPWESLLPLIDKYKINVVLSDLYPPPLQPHPWLAPEHAESAGQRVSGAGHGICKIQYYSDSVDATNLPDSLNGLRSLCGCFHHFRPDFAASILQDCIDKRLPVVVIETSARSIVQKFGSPFFMAGMSLATPIAYRRTTPWYLWVLTYVFPLTLICACFDGLASCSRAYQPDEMLAVAAKCQGAESYRWEAGTETFYGLFSLVFMTGRPLAANETISD
ncbi:hypothetical protein [Neorhodopirellula pilleata]|uniref:Methyltransferase domain protein n=1 Tax=Neorhodopirellula pilleata TaxID=2714738 RepID=A0A5C6ATV3_9BACT|nr:hypothetical protein [Neorhodopirellula pilleata]TWU01574.1 hypothetical protein Pla100_13090 [Neorhodopirellula pilleata]